MSASESAELLSKTADRKAGDILKAAALVISAVKRGGKVLACGNGGSAADAQHLAGELVGRFFIDRASYPCVALCTDSSVTTSLANDYGFESVFERQVEALGRKGDVLVAISTSGNSPNVLRAAAAAKRKGMKVIALTGGKGGKLAPAADVLLDVDSRVTPRIQETHGFMIHAICEIVEKRLSE